MCNSHLVCTNWYTVWKKPPFFSVKSEEKLNPPLSPPLSFTTVLLFSKKSFTALLLFTKNPSAWKWTRKQDLALSSQKTWERSRESFWQSYLPFWPQIISNIEVLGAKKRKTVNFSQKCHQSGWLLAYWLYICHQQLYLPPYWSFADSGLFREGWVHKTDKAFTVFSQTNSKFVFRRHNWFLKDSPLTNWCDQMRIIQYSKTSTSKHMGALKQSQKNIWGNIAFQRKTSWSWNGPADVMIMSFEKSFNDRTNIYKNLISNPLHTYFCVPQWHLLVPQALS